MPVEISSDTPPALVPLAWLIGRWEGAGVVGYPTMEEVRFGQEVEFRHDGRPFLHYRSQAWLLDDDGNQVRPLASETGYWRVPQPPAEEPAHAELNPEAQQPGTEIEVLLAHPTGFVEIYLGRVAGPRIDLVTDLVARTSTAKEYTSAQRMYGLVEGDLMWVMDMAAVGHELQPHASARLKRV
ncbi:MAG: FABP family protein [Actinomycetota bacterium]